MLEKLVWISAFMAVGTKHKVTVGEVEKSHTEEVSLLIKELAAAGQVSPLGYELQGPVWIMDTNATSYIFGLIKYQAELGITLDKGYVERLLAYGRSVSHFPTAIKEFPWRNGWFVEISKRELGKGLPDPMPLHSALLASVGA